ncbi:unnamed protein product [Calicophoron daubneyi]|uniref:Coiled-coil domain-containing protein n=1 Tax=Calicophoron daubneyi TaxID=300641 RepID=A0AAV2TPC5_CALDB
MPKKLGTCPKALEARERRAEKKKEEKVRKEKELEEQYWKDDDKLVNRKLHRRDEREDKRQEQLDKKRELRKLYEEELEGAKAKSSIKPEPSKLTQAQIASAREKLAAEQAHLSKKKLIEEQELQPNVNRVEVEGEEARTVEEAIGILNVGDAPSELDRHPERRIKAAYNAFEAKMMPIVRAENPGLRNSQLKQLIFKMFQTAPENPKNQAHGSYNMS